MSDEKRIYESTTTKDYYKKSSTPQQVDTPNTDIDICSTPQGVDNAGGDTRPPVDDDE